MLQQSASSKPDQLTNGKIKLPQPKYDSNTSIEKALYKRRSIRAYKDDALTLVEVSQLLWAVQGITDLKEGLRTAPSAGALYPLEVYIAIGNVKGLTKGVYKYKPQNHELVKVSSRDMRDELFVASLEQAWVKEGAIVIVLSTRSLSYSSKYLPASSFSKSWHSSCWSF